MKTLFFTAFLACSIVIAADKKKDDQDHNGGGEDKAHSSLVDKSPEISKIIAMMKRLTTDKAVDIQVNTTLDKDKPQQSTKSASPEEIKKIIAFIEEGKAFMSGLSTCSESGDNHAARYKELVEKCLGNILAEGFIKNIGVDEDLTKADIDVKWNLRGGSSDPIRVSESRLLQCRQSMEEVRSARKAAKVKVESDDAMVAKFDDVLKIFDFKIENLTKRDKGPIQKSIDEAGKAAMADGLITAKSCSPSKAKKDDKKKTDKKKKIDKEESDADDNGDKAKKTEKPEPSDEEKKDPPALNPIPRTGPTASSPAGAGGGDNGGNNGRDPFVPQQQLPTGGGAQFPNDANVTNPLGALNPLDFANLLRDPPDQSSRVGGSPSNTRGAPNFTAPSIPQGGGQPQQGPQQPEQQQQPQQAQQPFPPMGQQQQPPIIIGDPNSSAKSSEPAAKTATPAPGPAKEDVNAAEKKGWQDGYNQAMAAIQGVGRGMYNGAQAAMSTGQKLTAGMFGRGGNASRARRGSNSRQTAFAGTSGSSVSGRRSPNQFGRGSMQ